ncbi:MAG: SdpI family protein [Gemmatimonadaceae bacterium]
MRKWIPPLVIAVAFLASAVVYQDLPDRMPTHWNMSGEVDGWTSQPWGAFLIPIMLLVGLAIFHLIPSIDPRRGNYAKFKGTYEILIIAIMVFMLGVHLVILAAALGNDVSVARVMPLGVGILFMVIGNLLPRTRPNWFIGVRTPWTLSSDRVWERTHRFAGRLFVAAGALILLVGIVAPAMAQPVLIGSTVVVSVAVLVYSYVIWRGSPQERDKASGASVRRP